MADEGDDSIRQHTALRRWAVVRTVLGALQMFGAVATNAFRRGFASDFTFLMRVIAQRARQGAAWCRSER